MLCFQMPKDRICHINMTAKVCSVQTSRQTKYSRSQSLKSLQLHILKRPCLCLSAAWNPVRSQGNTSTLLLTLCPEKGEQFFRQLWSEIASYFWHPFSSQTSCYNTCTDKMILIEIDVVGPGRHSFSDVLLLLGKSVMQEKLHASAKT